MPLTTVDVGSFSTALARLMSEPIWMAAEELIEAALPHQKESITEKTKAYAWKFFAGGAALCSLPLTASLAIVSEVPRAFGNYYKQKNFSYHIGSAHPKTCPPLESRQLSILTANICGLPGGLSWIYGGIPHWRSRIAPILQKLDGSGCDVIVLTEVHDHRLAAKIVGALDKKYRFAVYDIGEREMGGSRLLNSGLLVLSKYEIQDPSFTSFCNVQGAQKAVNKGVFDFSLQTRLGEKIAHVFATHLEPSPDDYNPSPAEKKTRSLELDLIVEKMRGIVQQKWPNMPIILAGDLNIVHQGEEYKDSLLPECFFNGHPSKEPKTCTSLFSDIVWTYRQGQKNRIFYGQQVTLDYILILKKLPQPEQMCFQAVKGSHRFVSLIQTEQMYKELDPEGALSDHHALLGVIAYNGFKKLKILD